MTGLHVHTFGAGQRPVLAVHGINGHGARFRRLALDHLDGCTVHAVDLRGHGRSPWTPPWGLDQHIADLTATLGELGVHGVDLIGFSYGGLIVTHLAHALDGRAGRVVLLDPAVGIPPAVADQRAYESLADMSFPDVAAARAMRMQALPFASAEAIDTEIEVHLRRDTDGRYRWRVSRPAVVTAYSEMARPAVLPPPSARTLLVRGSRSPVVEPAYAHALGEAGAVIAEVDCGHQLMLERPEETGRLVRDFLN
jgi:lipase